MNIGFLGGGQFGHQLAQRLMLAGHDVLVGMRDTTRVQAQATYRTGSLAEAAMHGEVVVVAVLYSAAIEVLDPLATTLQAKIVVDATNALNDAWEPLALGEDRSAAEHFQRTYPLLRWVKAFNTIFADVIPALDASQAAKALSAFIAGDDDAANRCVAALANDAGMLPIITGALRNARYLEAMAHLNIQLARGQGGGTRAGFLYQQTI